MYLARHMQHCHISTVDEELTTYTNCINEILLKDQKPNEYYRGPNPKVWLFIGPFNCVIFISILFQ